MPHKIIICFGPLDLSLKHAANLPAKDAGAANLSTAIECLIQEHVKYKKAAAELKNLIKQFYSIQTLTPVKVILL